MYRWPTLSTNMNEERHIRLLGFQKKERFECFADRAYLISIAFVKGDWRILLLVARQSTQFGVIVRRSSPIARA